MLESEGPPTARFAAFIEQFAHMNMRYRIVSTIFLREEKHLSKESMRKLRNFEHSFDAKLTTLIQRGIDSAEFKVKDAQLASSAVGGMIRWMHHWHREDGRVSADEIARFMANLALCAVRCSRAEPKPKRPSRRASAR
jgi:TetR/AcrR family transcriptional regulator, cholesterol catabolism regulator